MKKFWIKEVISLDDWRAIHTLIKTNLPLQECLALLINKGNKKLFERILQALKAGQRIDEAVLPYLDKRLKSAFSSFIQVLTFEKALEMSLEIYDYDQKRQKQLRKDLVYPGLLFIFSLLGLYLFDTFGLDAIFNILVSFAVDIGAFYIFRLLIRLFIYSIFVILIICGLIFLFFKHPGRIVILYILVSRYFPDSLWQLYYSQNFIALFALCGELGYKTKETLAILKSMREKPLISFLAYHVDEAFMKGEGMAEALDNPYLDSRLQSFMKMAVVSLNFDKLLRRYVEVCAMDMERRIKKYTRIVQFSIYILIGVMLIFIYQVLFLPIQAIGQF